MALGGAALLACGPRPSNSAATTPGHPLAAAEPEANGTDATVVPTASPAGSRADKEPPIGPCKASSPAHRNARAALDQLDRQIDTLQPDGDPRPAAKALEALLQTPCYRLADLERPDSLEPDSGLALKTFWKQGGQYWVEHYLELAAPPPPNDARRAVIPPAMPKTLTRESAGPSHPLRPLLCSVHAPGCGRMTAGWARRARHAFAAFAQQRRLTALTGAPDDRPVPSDRSCAAQAAALPAADRYSSWRSCIAETVPQVVALPLGTMKAPEQGWLILRGRRGRSCDEIRAYDLATGAAYRTENCGRHGSQQGSGAARTPKQQVGQVPLDGLREAVWMTLLSDEVALAGVQGGVGIAIPEHVPVQRPAEHFGSVGLFGLSSTSGQSRLDWSYLRAGRAIKSGQLTWPRNDNDAARDHAVKLLQVAEDGFAQGCPPARLPTKLHFGTGKPGGSGPGASGQSHTALLAKLQKLRHHRVCPTRRR